MRGNYSNKLKEAMNYSSHKRRNKILFIFNQIDKQSYKSCRAIYQLFILCFLAILYGCGVIPSPESIVDDYSLINLENEKLVKLSEISNENWDVVCVLTPYSAGIGDDRGDDRIKTIQNKTPDLNLTISEGNWHLIFEKNGEVTANSFRTSRIDIQQKGFDAIRQKLFDLILFKPENCMDFLQATIYKFSKQGRDYISLGVVES